MATLNQIEPATLGDPEMPSIRFTEEQIQSIFGHEAAEDEKPERLKSYYFKSLIFEKVTAPLGLRILVGHTRLLPWR